MKKHGSPRKALPPGFRIVALGGGTGLSTLLRGLKERVVRRPDELSTAERPISDLAAIVTVTDDGGSSGRLRRENRILPPGDIRNCMVALSKDEALMGRLFQYRFHAGRGLAGHNFGNLFLAALTHVTGDFIEAIRVTSRVLAIRGRIFPSTLSNVRLVAILENGRVVHGETRISASRTRIKRLSLSPSRVRPLPAAVEAIDQADLILMGPGSLYTSVLTNLLIPYIAAAIARSKAPRVYIANLMTQRRNDRLRAGGPRLRHSEARAAPGDRLRDRQPAGDLARSGAPLSRGRSGAGDRGPCRAAEPWLSGDPRRSRRGTRRAAPQHPAAVATAARRIPSPTEGGGGANPHLGEEFLPR